jgi:hypothetical protein
MTERAFHRGLGQRDADDVPAVPYTQQRANPRPWAHGSVRS